jgi:hypothetical protein
MDAPGRHLPQTPDRDEGGEHPLRYNVHGAHLLGPTTVDGHGTATAGHQSTDLLCASVFLGFVAARATLGGDDAPPSP